MMLALPLGIIANNFGEYEKYSKRRQKVTDAYKQMDDEADINLDSLKKRKDTETPYSSDLPYKKVGPEMRRLASFWAEATACKYI